MKTIGLKTTTRVGPLLAFAPLASRATSEIQLTKTRGLDVLNSPSLNKGTAFSNSERVALGLTGLLPPEVSTLAQQVQGAYMQFERLPDALSKNIYLTALHDRNEVLFYNLFSEHLREMIPIVNDVTVGLAMKQYHHECRRPRGVYLSIHQIDQMEAALHNLGLGPNDVDLVLATDAENIMGVGDWGIGGVNPKRVIPVTLDAGTNEASLLNDAMYIGNRHERIRGKQYDDFIQAYVQTVSHLFPRALLQWEDFEPDNARNILGKYREKVCTFNDGGQGTGAITLAAINASSSSAPAPPASASPINSAMPWSAKVSPKQTPPDASGASTAKGSSARAAPPGCAAIKCPTPAQKKKPITGNEILTTTPSPSPKS